MIGDFEEELPQLTVGQQATNRPMQLKKQNYKLLPGYQKINSTIQK